MHHPLRHARNRGTVLVLVVVLSVIVTGLILTLALTVGVLSQAAGQEQHLDQAYYAAEAGLQVGITQLKSSFTNRAAIGQTALCLPGGAAVGTYAVTFSPTGTSQNDPATVTATGTSGSAMCKLACTVTPSGGPAYAPITLAGTLNMSAGTIDSYNSTLGPYGGTNVGRNASIVTNTTQNHGVYLGSAIHGNLLIGAGGNPQTTVGTWGSGGITGTIAAQTTNTVLPTAALPANLPPSAGYANLWNTNLTLNGGTYRYTGLLLSGTTVLNVSANSTIIVDGPFQVTNSSSIILSNGATLAIYVDNGDVNINNSGRMNMKSNGDPGTPSDLQITVVGNAHPVQFTNATRVAATIVNPGGPFQINNSAVLYGTCIANSLQVDNAAAIHADLAAGSPAGGAGTPALAVANYTLIR